MAYEIVQGEIATGPDSDGRVMVTTPLSGDQAEGPCPCAPHPGGVDPSPGDACLVAVSDNQAPSWVLAFDP